MRRTLLLPLALLACSRADPPPAGLTADDQAQLNDAAAMLDANSIDLNQVTEVDEPEAGEDGQASGTNQ